MDCSIPGFPVHHQLPELAQTHVIKSGMPSYHLILCCPLFLLPSVFPGIRVFPNESVLEYSCYLTLGKLSSGQGNGTPLQYFGHLMRRTDSLEKTLMLGKIEGGEGDDRG